MEMLSVRTSQNLSVKSKNRMTIGIKERRFLLMDKLGKSLGFKEMEDWYAITTEGIKANGGGDVLRCTRNSPSILVQTMFPDHDWIFGRFVDPGPISHQKYPGSNNIKHEYSSSSKMVELLNKKLKIENLEDWYRVSFKEINKWIPRTVLNKNSIGDLLQGYYPEHPWDLGRLENKRGAMKSSQRKLFILVKELFMNSGM